MRKVVRLTAVVAVLAIVAAACSKSSTPQTSSSASAGAEIQAGGTLNIAQTSDVSAAFDPQKEYYQLSFEYFKCCLLRTLLQTKELTAEQGGNELQPDLASALPTVSSDGLTYTFSIKPGIHYSPPLQDVTVTAGDFVRAIEREADPKASSGGYPFYYSVIEGFDDYGAGKADSISGITATDDYDARGQAHAAGRRHAVAIRHAGHRADPAEPVRPQGRPRHRGRAHHELRSVHRRNRPVHVRGHRRARLLGAGE